MAMKYFYLKFASSLKGKKKQTTKTNVFVSPETNLPPKPLRLQISGIWQQADNLESPGLKLSH